MEAEIPVSLQDRLLLCNVEGRRTVSLTAAQTANLSCIAELK